MLVENLGCERNRFLSVYGTVGYNLHRKLVVINAVTYTGILYAIFYLIYGSKYRINENLSDRCAYVGARICEIILLIEFGGNVASSLVKGNLHIETGVFAYGANVMLGVKNVKLGIRGDVRSGNNSRACYVNNGGFRLFAVELCNYTLYIKHDFRNVFLNTVTSGYFMKNTVYLNARCRISGKCRKKNSAKRVAESYTVTSYKRFYDKGSLATVLRNINGVDVELLYCIHHLKKFLLLLFCFFSALCQNSPKILGET